MKRKLVILLGLICFASVFAQESGQFAKSRFKLRENKKEFDVQYFPTKYMKKAKIKDNPDVDIHQAYTIKKDGLEGEVRFTFFTDVGGDSPSFRTAFSVWSLMCIYNVAGYEVPHEKISVFSDDNVKGEFNGDMGLQVFLQNPTSEYAKGYKYMWIQTFCKENQGIVMVTYLFNDVRFAIGTGNTEEDLLNSPLFANYDIFKFK